MTTPSSENRYRVAVRSAVVAAVFSAVVAALLVYDYCQRQAKTPFEETAYKTLKVAAAEHPDSQLIKKELRTLDQQIREAFFRHRQFTAVGAGLLAAGIGIFLLMARMAATLRRKLPHPDPAGTPRDRDGEMKAAARWGVAALVVLMLGVAVGIGVAARTQLPTTDEGLIALAGKPPETPAVVQGQDKPQQPTAVVAKPDAPDNAPPETPPNDEEMAKNWPRFRGPGGLGVSAYDNVPTRWNAASGEGIAWKTPVPLPGNNSPVVWGKRVFVSGSDGKRREVYCFDTDKGTLLWQKELPGTPASTAKVPKVNDDTGHAAPTTACDGRRVYAIFANGDLGAMTLDGRLAWSKSLGIPVNSYGHASSLMTYKNLLIVQFDQGSQGKDKKSRLLAFESATGKPAWETVREVPNSWASPISIHAADRDQIITQADPWCAAYDPADGKEIWRFKCLRQDIGPSATFANGLVFAVNTSPQLTAIAPDGKDDVTKTHGKWMAEDNLPDTCSPLATSEHVFLLATHGVLTCYDAKAGDMLWELEIEGQFNASPGLAGGKVYVISVDGNCRVVEPGPKAGKVVAESKLGEECVSSPAFQDGRIYLRGKKHLFCIGNR